MIRRRKLLIFLGLSTALIFTSIFTLPPVVASRIATAVTKSTGARCEIDGLGFGRTVRVRHVSLTPPNVDRPILSVENLVVRPDWGALLAGSVRFAEIEADTIRIHAVPKAEEWLKRLRAERAAKSKTDTRTIEWQIGTMRCPAIEVYARGLDLRSEFEASDLGSERWKRIALRGEIAEPQTTFAVEGDAIRAASFAGRWRVDARGVAPIALANAIGFEVEGVAGGTPLAGAQTDTATIPDGRWEVSIAFEDSGISAVGMLATAAVAGLGPIHAEFDFGASMTETMPIRNGSRLELTGDGLGAYGFSAIDLNVHGDLPTGYRLGGHVGDLAVDLHVQPADAYVDFILRGSPPPQSDVHARRLFLKGRLAETALNRWHLNARTEANIDLRVATPVAIRVEGDLDAERSITASPAGGPTSAVPEVAFLHRLRSAAGGLAKLDGWNARATIDLLEASGAVKKTPWSIRVEKARFAHAGDSTALVFERPARVVWSKRTLSVRGEVARSGSNIATRGLSIDDIPLEASIVLSGRSVSSAKAKIAPVSPLEFRDFLPVDLAPMFDASEMDGTVSGEISYDAKANELKGELAVELARFRYAAQELEIRDVSLRVPVRQKLVNPGTIEFTSDEMRYPEMPGNFSIGRISRRGVAISNVTGTIFFSDYVLRAYNMNMEVFGGEASGIFWLDPFRRDDGKMMTLLELDMKNLALDRIYAAFVGEGEAARSLSGALNGLAIARWYDASPDTYIFWIESAGKGKVGARVIAALNKMQPKEKRLSKIALAFLGSYKYDLLVLRGSMTPDVDDIWVDLEMLSPREPLLKELRLAGQMNALIRGLPTEVKVGLRDRRGRSE